MSSPREARRGPDSEIWVADYHNEEIKAFQVAVRRHGLRR